MDELKPCPFCGGEPVRKWNHYPDGDDNWLIKCEPCNIIVISLHPFLTIERWNTRPLEDAMRVELEAAKGHASGLEADRDRYITALITAGIMPPAALEVKK